MENIEVMWKVFFHVIAGEVRINPRPKEKVIE